MLRACSPAIMEGTLHFDTGVKVGKISCQKVDRSFRVAIHYSMYPSHIWYRGGCAMLYM